jgi:hypothetical protein
MSVCMHACMYVHAHDMARSPVERDEGSPSMLGDADECMYLCMHACMYVCILYRGGTWDAH